MTPVDVENFIANNFGGISIDHPWTATPEYTIFRHVENRKWFAAMLTATYSQLSRLVPDDPALQKYRETRPVPQNHHLHPAPIWILNLKLNPDLIPIVTATPGVLPAWHMNRRHWVSILLDGSVQESTLANLIDQSYSLTAPRKANRRD